jgi:hypothetical protein
VKAGGFIMKWLTLYNKIGKQPIRNINKSDVTVMVDNKEIKVSGIKFKVDGTPYLITEPRK